MLDLCKRNFSNFTFPVEQVQTVYRLLVRAEPGLLERLCMAIRETEAGEDREEEGVANYYAKRKDDTSKVLVYNSYIYPTLEKMKKLRHVVLHGLCDNQMLSILGQNCTTLQYLDISGQHSTIIAL